MSFQILLIFPDRTKDLLYQGSMKSCSPCNQEPMSDWTEGEGRTPIPAQSMQGQLCIGSDGHLCGASEPTPMAVGFQFQVPLAPHGGAEAMDTGAGLMENNNTVIMPYPPPAGQMTLDPSGRLCNKGRCQWWLWLPCIVVLILLIKLLTQIWIR